MEGQILVLGTGERIDVQSESSDAIINLAVATAMDRNEIVEIIKFCKLCKCTISSTKTFCEYCERVLKNVHETTPTPSC